MIEIQDRIRDRLKPVAQIVRDAGGRIVGRTKLQKTAYLLKLAGFESPYLFSYKHYGPFSEGLAEAAELAAAFDVIDEIQQQAGWGGTYSIYQASGAPSDDTARVRLAQAAAGADAVLLELAATAAYLANEGKAHPWTETAERKPDKAADGRLERAKALYTTLRTASGGRLPALANE
jgi:uncharacterized protein YwgA